MSQMAQTEIPDYLREPSTAERYYGKLVYDQHSESWIMDADPNVVELAKRLFPGSSGIGRGKARFKLNKRTIGDLNWLMLRYPLEIENKQAWERARTESIQYTLLRNEINKRPQKVEPLHFRGELKSFQKEALAFLMNNRRCLIADDMGLGKTIDALAFLSTTESYPALIVVQSHLITNWKREIGRFLNPPAVEGQQMTLFSDEPSLDMVHVIRGRKSYEIPPASIYIIHYGLLAYHGELLKDMGVQTIIFDEIQDLRHDNTKKYSVASMLSEAAENVIGLSGTPIFNRGGEIWSIMNILEYHVLGDWDSFSREWAVSYGSDIIENPELLGDYLKREGLMLRRTKTEVQSELPPKRRVVQTVDFDEDVYDDLIEYAERQAHEIQGEKDLFVRGRATRQIVNDTRQATGISKAPYAAQFVNLLLEAGEKVLLFAWHHRVFDILQEKLADHNPRRISGRDSSAEKDEAVRQFMDGETNLLLISLRASAGLNLQRASTVVFAELDWAPAVHSQGEDRAHRMGQEDSVLCYYLVSETGSDEDMQESLGLKVSQFTGIMGDATETEEDRVMSQTAASEHMNRIVEKLQKRKAKLA